MSARRSAARAVAVTLLVATGLALPGTAAAAPVLTVGVDVANVERAAEPGADPNSATTRATYRIVVSNRGTDPATSVRVSDPVPTDTTFRSSTPAASPPAGGGAACSAGAPSSTVCEWLVGNLAPGGSATIDVTFDLAVPTGLLLMTITNAVSASADGGHSASNTDVSLKRRPLRNEKLDDTFVDHTAPADTAYGICNELRMRRDDSMTAFIRSFNVDLNELGERVWAAELRAKIKSADPLAPSTTVALHRVSSNLRWEEGGTGVSGQCNGNVGSGGEPRTGFAPDSAEQVAVASFSGVAGATVAWDVYSGLDSEAEREAHAGWEMIDLGTNAPGAVSVFHSREAAAAADRPLLLLTYTEPEPATCIEVTPQSLAATSPNEALFTARITDGSRAATGTFCNGAGVPGDGVSWTLEDDDPNAYFSTHNGSPTSSQSNAVLTPAGIGDQAGVASVGVRLAQPDYGSSGSLGDSRIAASVHGSADPEGCAQTPCPTESATEDDVAIAWTRGPAPPAPPAPPDPPDPPPPPEARTDGASTVGAFSATLNGAVNPKGDPDTRYYIDYGQDTSYGRRIPSDSGTLLGHGDDSMHPVSETPIDLLPQTTYHYRVVAVSPAGLAAGADQQFTTGAPSVADDPQPDLTTPDSETARAVHARPQRTNVPWGRAAVITGAVAAAVSSCVDAQKVQLWRRARGSSWRAVARAQTTARGRFGFNPIVSRSARYRVMAEATPNCAAADSKDISIKSVPRLTIRRTLGPVETGGRLFLRGTLRPGRAGSQVILERKSRRGWRPVGHARLGKQSRYRLPVRASWNGTRIFRARWAGDDKQAPAVSRPLAVAAQANP